MKFIMLLTKSPSPRGTTLLLASALAALWLSGCASNVPPPAARSNYIPGIPATTGENVADIVTAGSRSGDGAINRNNIDGVLSNKQKPQRKAAEERPGLATSFGEQVTSPWNRQSFVRASSKPDGTGVVYYNNREGIDAMTGSKSKVEGTQLVSGEKIEWGIKGGMSYLPTYSNYWTWGNKGRRFVVGKKDSGYSIVLKNRCKSRLEVVLSVDGLDVIDGKAASVSKRGYVIAPDETLEVKGWRTSPDTVARFRFSTVSGSYANLSTGEHRNVGVIGLAVFTEKGVDPWTWMPTEVNDRLKADPFAKAP